MENITYTEEEISDIAYWIMNNGYCENMEAGDIKGSLLYAENLVFPDCPYSFTMEENEEDCYTWEENEEEYTESYNDYISSYIY